MKVPTDVPVSAQRALIELDNRIFELEAAIKNAVGPEALTGLAQSLRATIRDATQEPGYRTWEQVFGSADIKRSQAVYGETPSHVVREDGRWSFPNPTDAALGDAVGAKQYCLDGHLSVAGHLTASNLGGIAKDIFGAGARLWNSANQNFTGNSVATLSFDTVIFDSDGMYSSAAPTRLTIRTPGKYLVGGNAYESSTNVISEAIVVKNGANIIVRQGVSGTSSCFPACATLHDFVAGDYVTYAIVARTAGTLIATSAVDYAPVFWAHRLSL